MALALLYLDLIAVAVLLMVPIFLLARTVDRLDRPVEEEMTKLLLERAWVMTPADRREAFERWDERFGAVRKREEVRSALEAMPGGVACEERRRWISGGGLLGAAGFVMGILVLVTGVAGLAMGRPVATSLVLSAGGLGMLFASRGISTKSSARPEPQIAGNEGAKRSRGRWKGVSRATVGAVIAVVAVSFAAQKLGLAESGDFTMLPPMPVAPAGVVEYRGTTSEGMPMVVWRRPGSVFIRVDSAESACGIGANFAGHRVKTRNRKRFAARWTYDTTAVFARPSLFARSEELPKRVDAEAYGKFLPGGRAEGRFTRRDRIRDGDETVLDCTRSVKWTAREI